MQVKKNVSRRSALNRFQHRRQICALATTAIAGLIAGSVTVEAAESSRDSEEAERPIPEIRWDTGLSKFQFDAEKFVGQRLTVRCPPAKPNQPIEDLYGTDNYPSESSICAAALHAGVITRDGGMVTIQLNPGLSEYVGSERNGITTGNLPATARSFTFVTDATREENDRQRSDYIPRIDWNTSFTRTGFAYRNLVGQRFTFRAPSAPHDKMMRIVYGTDHYDFSSKLCTAALHAGAITREGGVMTVQLDGRVERLIGSQRNGVATKSKQGRDRSLSFVKP